MARIPAILRLSPKLALAGNTAFFAKAVARAAAKPPPPPPNPPQYSSPQVTTPVQWNGGNTTFHPVQATNSTPFPGYGVYSPEYLQQLELNSEPPIYGPTVPENSDSPVYEPLNFDPTNQSDVFLPADNVADQEPALDEEAIEQAEDLADDIAEGKGLGLFGDDELSREEVVEQLEAGGYEVELSEWGLAGDNVTRTTITDPETGENIHEYYDHDTDRYWVEVTGEDGETLSQSPVRDDEGRKVTVSEDEESGERTTRLEDDLGDGSVVEITELPGSDVATITTTDSDGNSETVVVAEDGTRTTLDPEQETTREGIDEIVEAFSEGKSIDAIAEEMGLDPAQVIAQLAAAGFEVSENTEPDDSVSRRIVDTRTGENIASYQFSMNSFTSSTLYVDAAGNEVRRTEYQDGRSVEVVEETNGRKTVTSSSADGETTIRVTDNGYTLTTPPDGDLTVRRNENGREFTVARGTEEQTLAEELLELNPNDSDEDEVLQAVIEEMLVERDDDGNLKELEDLETELEEQEAATREAITEILGEDGDESDVIKPGQDVSVSDPLGAPPDEETSNGEDWVSMRYEGEWVWVDPAVAEALEKEETARTSLERAQAEAWRRQEQIEVYTHSDEIMGNVGDRLDELLAPHGLRWVAPEPKGTAEEAQEGLDNANAWIEYIETKEEYRALQEEADDLKERALEIYGDDVDYEDYFEEEGFEEVTESSTPRNPQGEKEDTGELLYQSVVEKDGQLYLRNVYADRDEPIYKKLTQDPASDPNGLSDAQWRLNQDWHNLKLGEEPAQLQNDALEAFREANPDYFDPDGYSETRSSGGPGGREYEWDSGEFRDARIVERDGQLYVVITHGEGSSKTTEEHPLTYAPGEEPEGLTQAEREASQAWQEFTRDKHVNEDLETRILDDARERHPDYFEDEGFTEITSSPAGTQENPSGALLDQQVIERDGQLFLVNTYENLDEPLEIQLTFDPDGSGSTARSETQQQVDEDWESWKAHRYSGEGGLVQVAQEHAEAQRTLTEVSNEQNAEYIEELEGTIPDLERALEEAIEENGEGTVVPGGEDAEQIELDGETRWVHPEVAAAHHDLAAARNALGEGEDILERAKELYGEQHPDHVKPGGFYESKTEGNYTAFVSTGDLIGEDDDFFVGEDGQLYLRNRYEDRDDPYEFPLTYAPGEAPEGRTEAQREIDRQWADWWEEHGGDSEDPLAEATQRVNGAEEARSVAIEEYGGGTTKELTGPLPDDVEPVLVMIDGEQRWVHPDVATALGALSMVENQIASVRVAMEEVELALEEADYRSARPSTWKLLDDAASLEHEQGVMVEWQMEDAYLDANGTGGTLARARQDRVESREVLLTTQIGLAEAGLPMASVDGKGADHDVTELREALEDNDVLGEQLAESSQWNDFLRGKSLDDRLDPEQGQELQVGYFVENPEVVEGATLDRLADLPSSVSMGNESAVRQTLGEALGTHESAVVDPVLDQLRELGGSNADVDIVPILYRDSSEGVRDTALFRVRDEDGRAWLVDESGSKYRNFEDYRQHNYLSDKGHVFLPESPNRLTDASGDLTYEWHQARELSFTEQWLDPIIGIGTGIATVASFIPPLAPIAAPIAFAGGAYFGARSISNIHEMHEHGRPLASTEGVMQGAMLATSFLPMGASAFRFAGLTRAGTPTGVAVRTSTGAVNTWGKAWSQNPMYQEAAEQLTQRGVAFSTARGLDRAAMGIGIPLMGYSGVNLATNWEDMTGLERSDALIGLGSGLFGAGMGYQASRAARPNQGAPETLTLGKLPARHGDPTPPLGLPRLYRLGDLEALNQASVDGALPAGYHVHFVQPGRLDSTNFVLSEGTVLRGGRVDGDGHIRWSTSRREQPTIYTLSDGGNGRQTVHLQDSGSGRVLRNRDFDNEAYVLVTDKSASQLRRTLNPNNQDTQPFALYNGREGNWGSARSYQKAIRHLLLSVGTLGGAISLGGPPEISMPLNALAYGVRGALLGIQAVFPNATAVDTGLGRLLRGGVFLTFAINVPGTVGNYMVNDGQYQLQLPDGGLGWASAGQEWAYALGNSAYMLKAFDEASTGKSARSWVNDAALPLFVAGGAEGLASSAWTSGWPPDAMTGYNATTNAMLAGGATRLWIRDGTVGKKVGSWLSSHMPHLSGIAKFNKRDVATLIGFTGTLIPAAAMGMKDHFDEQVNTEGEDIDPELFGYVPSDFSPPETPSSGEKADNVPPGLADEPATYRPLAEEIQLVVLDRQGTALHTDPVGVSPVVTHYPHGTFLEQAGSRVTDGDGNEWVPVRLGSDGEPVGWTMAQGVTEHPSGAMGESGRFNPEYEGRYAAVTVEPHQTLGGIAVRKGHDVEQVVMLNLDHIIDPSILFPGDRVYLPVS